MDAEAQRPGRLSSGRRPTRLGAAYAQRLLDELRLTPQRPVDCPAEHPAIGWAGSGLMALTGRSDGAPRVCPIALTACADGALAALASLAPPGSFDGLRGSQLLAERAAIAGFSRNGAASPGGACHLLQGADGWFALNLPRDDDWALLPAWLEADVGTDWLSLRSAVCGRPVSELVERARLLGLAAAPEGTAADSPVAWCTRMSGIDASPRALVVEPQPERAPRKKPPLVVDLSSLWAGPLCSHLLQAMGADVVKVESPKRPDGARFGPPEFFDLINANKRSAAFDPTVPTDREHLHALLAHADIVIEGSRPRGLRQLGIDAEAVVRENPWLTWISITGYGRGEPQENWVAYGDDAGVAAGLSRLMFEASGEHLFVGDAIGDPLTGLHAALAAWAGWCAGGAGLVSVALKDVVRHCIEFDAPRDRAALRRRWRNWTRLVEQTGIELAAPRARRPVRIAHALGADTAAVLSELDLG